MRARHARLSCGRVLGCPALGALATAGFIRAAGAFRRASADSNVSSMHDGAIVSAILALLFAAVILVAGLWSALILIRSVLRPTSSTESATTARSGDPER